MKKIGIITLNGYSNYGNRLQNYALQKTLESLGFFAETVIVDSNDNEICKKKVSNVEHLRNIKTSLGDEIIEKLIKKFYYFVKRKEIIQSNHLRTEIFKSFSKIFIKETNFSISINRIPDNLINEYDYFVTGSDQVWNPNFPEISEIYFLTFVPLDKRIAYAPSFGISELSNEHKQTYSKWLNEMTHISVREDAGASIISELTGRNAIVLVDPTLLLTKEEWIEISKNAINKPKREYLLTYFLGGIPKEFKKQITDIANMHSLQIVNLGDVKEKETYRTGPSEFIDYICDCSILCTDSFHGVVFSIIFEKPFIVYERTGKTSMYSRINTILQKFDFNSRKIENLRDSKDYFNVDFSHVPSILEKERKKSLMFLKNALNNEVAN